MASLSSERRRVRFWGLKRGKGQHREAKTYSLVGEKTGVKGLMTYSPLND